MKYDKNERIPVRIVLDSNGKKQATFLGGWKNEETYTKADLEKGNAIGFRTGNKTFAVVDVDTKDFSLINEPFQSWIKERMEKKDGTLVETKHGYHFYISAEHGLGTTSKVDRLNPDEDAYVDVRGNGGLVFIASANPEIASYELLYENGFFPLDGISDLLPRNDGKKTKAKEYATSNPIEIMMKATDGLGDDEVIELFLKAPTSFTEGNEWLKLGMALYDRYEGTEQGAKVWADYVNRCYAENPDNDWNSTAEKDIAKWDRGYLIPNKVDHIHLIFRYDEMKEAEFISRIDNADDKNKVEIIEKELSNHKWKNNSTTAQSKILTNIAEPLVCKRKEVKLDTRKKQVGSFVRELLSENAVLDVKRGDSFLNNIVYVTSFLSSVKYVLLDTFEKLDETATIGRNHKNLDKLKVQMGLKTLPISLLVKKGMITSCSSHEYNPFYKTTIFKDEYGAIKYNLFRHKSLPETAVDYTDEGQEAINYFVKHLELIMGVDNATTLLDYLAWCTQNIGKKILWSPLIQSAEGIGKSVIGTTMINHVFGISNAEPISAEVVIAPQTGWACNGVFKVLEEVKISGHNRFETVNKLKTLITETKISRVEKYERSETVPMFANFLALTNFKDAVPVSDTDRRWWFVFCSPQSVKEIEKLTGKNKYDYFAPLHKLAEAGNPHGKEFKKFLTERVISKDFTSSFAPVSEHKDHAVATEEASTPYLSEMRELIEKGHTGVGVDVFAYNKLTEAMDVSELFDTSLPRHDVIGLIKRLGYQKFSKRVKSGGENYNVWFKDMGLSESTIKQRLKKLLIETEPLFEDLDEFLS